MKKFTKKQVNNLEGWINNKLGFAENEGSKNYEIINPPELRVVITPVGGYDTGKVFLAVAFGGSADSYVNYDVILGEPIAWLENENARLATSAETRRFMTGRNKGDNERKFKVSDIYESINNLNSKS